MGIGVVIPAYPNPKDTDIENRDASIQILKKILKEVGSLEAAIELMSHKGNAMELLERYVTALQESELGWGEITEGRMKQRLINESCTPQNPSITRVVLFGGSMIITGFIALLATASNGCPS